MATLSVKEIRKQNPQGKMSMEIVNGKNTIIFDNGVRFYPETGKSNLLWQKLLRMGYDRHYNFSSDETDGIVQAAELGENPFAFTMICSNPSLNVKV